MELLDIQGSAVPEQSRTHIRIPFELQAGADRMQIRFEYAPKILEDREAALDLLKESYERYILPEQREQAIARADRHLPLKNLITLSLDDPNGYRGACHRHDPVQELFVSREAASPGLMSGKLEAGTWIAMLSLHCIVTETCDYRLRIRAVAEEEPA
ncbi:hypothetical protein [Saccharibacillus deserti]|uniref:hypothetical protein n=1 Tax=Saccharibacillus deserti TaxID=1634444 RepID=UPI001557C310|nr:hypothetical protein [Saccharibacillus deserti]